MDESEFDAFWQSERPAPDEPKGELKMTMFFWPLFSGFIRHALTTVGGALVVGGYVDEATWAQISGGILALIGVGWSFIEKTNR